MRRSIGVTISAILVLLGSLLWLGLTLLMLMAFVFTAQPTPSAGAPQALATGVATLLGWALCSAVGVATAVGLFRLKRWARISLLIFASFLSYLGSVITISLLLFSLPPSSGTSPEMMAGIRVGMLAFFTLPMLAFGGWWLYLFNRPSIRAQFPQPMGGSRRPASITVIALLLLVGAVGTLLLPVFHVPIPVFGVMLSGWAAALITVLQGLLALVLGIGLLRLNESARKVAIGYLVYGILNILLFALLPGLDARVSASLEILPSEMRASGAGIQPGQMVFWMMQSVLLMAIQLWLLIRGKPAFATVYSAHPGG